MWCIVCGAYAETRAKGLTAVCHGEFTGVWKGGGRLAQLKSLKAGLHPKTRQKLPPAIPECEWGRIGHQGPNLQTPPSVPVEPVTVGVGSGGPCVGDTHTSFTAALLGRVLAKKRRVSQGDGKTVVAKHRRVTAKSTPLVVGGQDVAREGLLAPR